MKSPLSIVDSGRCFDWLAGSSPPIFANMINLRNSGASPFFSDFQFFWFLFSSCSIYINPHFSKTLGDLLVKSTDGGISRPHFGALQHHARHVAQGPRRAARGEDLRLAVPAGELLGGEQVVGNPLGFRLKSLDRWWISIELVKKSSPNIHQPFLWVVTIKNGWWFMIVKKPHYHGNLFSWNLVNSAAPSVA